MRKLNIPFSPHYPFSSSASRVSQPFLFLSSSASRGWTLWDFSELDRHNVIPIRYCVSLMKLGYCTKNSTRHLSNRKWKSDWSFAHIFMVKEIQQTTPSHKLDNARIVHFSNLLGPFVECMDSMRKKNEKQRHDKSISESDSSFNSN